MYILHFFNRERKHEIKPIVIRLGTIQMMKVIVVVFYVFISVWKRPIRPPTITMGEVGGIFMTLPFPLGIFI